VDKTARAITTIVTSPPRGNHQLQELMVLREGHRRPLHRIAVDMGKEITDRLEDNRVVDMEVIDVAVAAAETMDTGEDIKIRALGTNSGGYFRLGLCNSNCFEPRIKCPFVLFCRL